MRKHLLVFAAVSALALTACSSDDGSDASPGDNGGDQSPQASISNPPPGDNGNPPPPGGSAFCQMIADSTDLSDDLNEANDTLDDLLADQANWDSPETIEALHAQGQLMLEYADDIAAIYRHAASTADDPQVSDALTTMADYFETMFTAMGQAAVEADSMMEYFMGMGNYLNQAELTQLAEDLSEAGPIIADYVYTTCGMTDFDY